MCLNVCLALYIYTCNKMQVYLIKRTHEVLVPIQHCVNQLDKFTMNLQHRLHKLGRHLQDKDQRKTSERTAINAMQIIMHMKRFYLAIHPHLRFPERGYWWLGDPHRGCGPGALGSCEVSRWTRPAVACTYSPYLQPNKHQDVLQLQHACKHKSISQ